LRSIPDKPCRNDPKVTKNATAAARLNRITFLNCSDAKLFSAEVELSEDDRARLASALAWLQDAGVLLLPAACRPEGRMTAGDLIDHLRALVGDHIVDAALLADPGRPACRDPAPAAVMPVWRFEVAGDDPDDRDVLLASGRLWGADLLMEALRVEDPDHPEPVREVRSRYDRWIRAAGGRRLRAVIHPPGEKGCYFLAAVAAPT
jgi:hypothetical protein